MPFSQYDQRQSKSVLDGFPVKQTGFAGDLDLVQKAVLEAEQPGVFIPPQGGSSISERVEKLEIVGHCPSCGAPLYGPKKITIGPPIEIRYSCDCVRNNNRLKELKFETK